MDRLTQEEIKRFRKWQEREAEKVESRKQFKADTIDFLKKVFAWIALGDVIISFVASSTITGLPWYVVAYLLVNGFVIFILGMMYATK